ncbi:AbgT family transporter [Hydrocoleum sp. CS-953]|uniref:AbgT family transporter n=1 Tax=Microcoleaceae TaxID=1892252 RepID=UPI000B9BFBD5|nr:AbgT family transporter [Hydrocoleum sp. CS-953]OZH55247.1 aminobenzoyl-glutamate transporter [Hydrocoleum sp. CS-953]
MTETPPPEKSKKLDIVNKGLIFIEKAGNKLPDPITLFFYLSVAVIVISAIANLINLSAVNPTSKETIEAVSLLTPDGIRKIVTKTVSNFVNFPPLGTVLVAMLGVGVAESTGLISALLRQVVLVAPAKFITPVIVFCGVMSNIASDAGYVVLTPLAALIFLAYKRHPIAGLAAGFAGVSGGYSANLLVSSIDPLLAGITESSAQLINPEYTVNPTVNYYFMVVSTFVITLVGWYITDKIVEPRLGEYNGQINSEEMEYLTTAEQKGLRWAGYSLLAFVAFLLILVLPPEGILRDPETLTIIPSPFFNGIVPIIMLGFIIPGIAYGKGAGTIQSDKDIAKGMSEAMSIMGYYIALSFFAAQFVAYFNWTNLGIILAINGANFLKATGFTGLPLLISFIIVSGLINLFFASASSKWTMIAPIFVPMLMLVGYSPEFTQMAYRIGDSTTNIITPLMGYFPIIVAFAQRYDKNAGMGTLIATMLPYSLAFLLSWSALFIFWFIFGIPIGPGATIRL